MKIIVCVDKSNGMMFNNRRQSQDKVLISKIIELSSGYDLLTSSYSSNLFNEYDNVISSDDFLLQANSDSFCFIENTDILKSDVDEIYIFNWNRDYPADKYFDFDLEGFKRIKKEDFVGNSHKKITLEIYRRV